MTPKVVTKDLLQGELSGTNLKLSDGTSAIDRHHLKAIKIRKGESVLCSADVDRDYKSSEPTSPRWDYLLVLIGEEARAVWVEPHSATHSREVAVVVAKANWLRSKLYEEGWFPLNVLSLASNKMGRGKLRWLAVGKCNISRNSKYARQLAQARITFPEKTTEL